MKVKEIMSSPVYFVDGKKTAVEVAKLMVKKNISSIIATKEEGVLKPVKDLGVVTERDLIKKVIAVWKSPDKVLVSDLMSQPIICVPPETEIHEINKLMKDHHIRRVFVSEDDTVIGIVSQRDILEHLRYNTVRRLVQLE